MIDQTVTAEVPTEDGTGSAAGALFPGDTGTFDRPTRVALVKLLQGPYLDASADPEAWAAMRRADAEVRRFLAEVFLTLVVDDDERIAFTQQAQESTEPYPKLLRHLSLSLVDSALLLYLRQELASAAGRGQRAVVGVDEITAQLLPYRNDRTTDHSVHAKRIDAAIKRMKVNGILRSTATEGRWEVSPVLKILLPPDRIAALLEAYDRLRIGAPRDALPDDAAEKTTEDDGVDTDDEVADE
jgi:hypothetical protein